MYANELANGSQEWCSTATTTIVGTSASAMRGAGIMKVGSSPRQMVTSIRTSSVDWKEWVPFVASFKTELTLSDLVFSGPRCACDVECCLHQYELPTLVEGYFCSPGSLPFRVLRAHSWHASVGVSTLMDWNWSVHLSQVCHEYGFGTGC